MPIAADPELLTILRGCRERDRPSQNALYRRYYAFGMGICIRYVDSRAEATTILNDGFLRVFRHIRRYDAALPFENWLHRILVNAALDYLKKQRKFKAEVSMDEAKHLSGQEDILSRISYQELIDMIQSLSTAYRTVFNLYVIDGFRHEEIAERLGISVSTSKSNLARARMRLQELVTAKLNGRYV